LQSALKDSVDKARAEAVADAQKKTEGLVDQIQNHFKSVSQTRIKELDDLKNRISALDRVFDEETTYKTTSYKVRGLKQIDVWAYLG